jgi:4-hydroxybenzoate polyprenyltransferase
MAAFTTNLPPKIYMVHLLKWLVGAFILRSSACTINDILDRNMDACVGQFTACQPKARHLFTHPERTKNRPLPSGRLSVFAASIFLSSQYAIGIAFFYLTIHNLAYVSTRVKLYGHFY